MGPIMVGNSSLISLACPFSGGSGPHQGSLSDDRSRCSQVGRTHPRLRWVWQRPEGESRLWLVLSLISSQLPGAPGEAMERLLIAEPAARETCGQMWPRSQSFTAVYWKWCRIQSHQTPAWIPRSPLAAKPVCLKETHLIPNSTFSPGSLPIP